MLKKILSLAVICTALSSHANLITDFIKGIDDYDVLTLTKASQMFKDENVGMEVFRASGLKGSLYQDGCGVNLTSQGTTYTIEGFYNGNFDVKMGNALVAYTLNGEDNPGRETKPDGTPGDYAGKYLSITPCLVIKDIIYVPLDLSNIELIGSLDGMSNVMGYASKDDGSGLTNLHFDAISMPNLGSSLSTLIPAESLAALIKAGVNASLQNETIRQLVGGIIDGIVGSGEDANYLSLLDGAKLNAMQLQIYEYVTAEDGTVTKKVIETENFNGYQLHTIKSMGYITDRVITETTLGYGTKKDSDPNRTYKFAYKTEPADENGNQRVSFYNFNNGGMAIHTEVVQVTTDEEVTETANSKRFATTLHPVTGQLTPEGIMIFDNKQMLGCEPVLVLDGNLGSYLNSVTVKRLTPCENATLVDAIRPVWDFTGTATIETASSIGKPSHVGANTWSTTHGGALKTMPTALNIQIGAYCAQRANMLLSTGSATDLRTCDFITYDGELQIEAEMPECTHDVQLVLTKVGFTGALTPSLYVAGSILPDETTSQYVESYDLMVVPKNVESYTHMEKDESVWFNGEFGFEHGHKGLTSIGTTSVEGFVIGAQYDMNVNKVQTMAVSGSQSFEKLVPYADLKKVTSKKTLFVTTYDVENATETDDYTFYVRTNYTAESGLAPSFHALTPKSVYAGVTTGVDNITVAPEDANAPAEYFTIQGVQLSQRPIAPGVYIERHGKTSKKILVK